MIAGVGVALKYLKYLKTRKQLIQNFDKATKVTHIYKQSSGTDIPSHVPDQTIDHYILDINPSTISVEIASILLASPSCNCSGEEEKKSSFTNAYDRPCSLAINQTLLTPAA